jgi:hypothetical protein
MRTALGLIAFLFSTTFAHALSSGGAELQPAPADTRAACERSCKNTRTRELNRCRGLTEDSDISKKVCLACGGMWTAPPLMPMAPDSCYAWDVDAVVACARRQCAEDALRAYDACVESCQTSAGVFTP